MPQERAYRRSLGLVELVCLGVGGTIGSGIFVVPGTAAGIAGASSLLAWLFVAVSACSVAFALGSIQARSPAGTPFTALFAPVFGRPAAALLVASYALSSAFGIATIAAGLGQYFAFLGVGHLQMLEMVIIAVFLGLNLLGIALSGAMENALSLLKLLGIGAIIVALAPFLHARELLPARIAPVPALLEAVIIVYWPFTGFEISAIPVAETKEPARIARALMLVLALVCVTYLGLNVVLIGAVGAAELATSEAPVAYAVGRIFPGAGPLVAVLGIVTMLSALNAYVVGASRVVQNGAEAFCLERLASLSGRGVPAVALFIACGSAAALLLVSNRFDVLAAAAVLMTLVPYVAICWAAFAGGTGPIVRLVSLCGAILTSAILVLYFAL
jgi:amino acid efflux transporter